MTGVLSVGRAGRRWFGGGGELVARGARRGFWRGYAGLFGRGHPVIHVVKQEVVVTQHLKGREVRRGM